MSNNNIVTNYFYALNLITDLKLFKGSIFSQLLKIRPLLKFRHDHSAISNDYTTCSLAIILLGPQSILVSKIWPRAITLQQVQFHCGKHNHTITLKQFSSIASKGNAILSKIAVILETKFVSYFPLLLKRFMKYINLR